MSGSADPVAIAIVGPTASGKTSLGVEVARRLGGEIISMDSRQVYRGMDIGTAKATAAQRSAIPHHGLDLVDPNERFSAGRYARFARSCIAAIRGRGHVPVLVGGTGFFLRGLTDPIFREPAFDLERRAALHRYLEAFDTEVLVGWVRALDPELAARFSSGGGGGRQRILRALEMALLTGRPLSWWQREGPLEAEPIPIRIFVLDPPREVLYAAIDRRVDEMLAAGLLEEVRSLHEQGYRAGDPGMNATGYSEVLPVVAGESELDEAAEQIRRNTRSYARRQLTWLRHQLPPGAVWLDPADEAEDPADRVVREWRRANEPDGRAGAVGSPPRNHNNERRDAE